MVCNNIDSTNKDKFRTLASENASTWVPNVNNGSSTTFTRQHSINEEIDIDSEFNSFLKNTFGKYYNEQTIPSQFYSDIANKRPVPFNNTEENPDGTISYKTPTTFSTLSGSDMNGACRLDCPNSGNPEQNREPTYDTLTRYTTSSNNNPMRACGRKEWRNFYACQDGIVPRTNYINEFDTDFTTSDYHNKNFGSRDSYGSMSNITPFLSNRSSVSNDAASMKIRQSVPITACSYSITPEITMDQEKLEDLLATGFIPAEFADRMTWKYCTQTRRGENVPRWQSSTNNDNIKCARAFARIMEDGSDASYDGVQLTERMKGGIDMINEWSTNYCTERPFTDKPLRLLNGEYKDENGLLIDSNSYCVDWCTSGNPELCKLQRLAQGKAFYEELIDAAPQTGDDSIFTPGGEIDVFNYLKYFSSEPVKNRIRSEHMGCNLPDEFYTFWAEDYLDNLDLPPDVDLEVFTSTLESFKRCLHPICLEDTSYLNRDLCPSIIQNCIQNVSDNVFSSNDVENNVKCSITNSVTITTPPPTEPTPPTDPTSPTEPTSPTDPTPQIDNCPLITHVMLYKERDDVANVTSDSTMNITQIEVYDCNDKLVNVSSAYVYPRYSNTLYGPENLYDGNPETFAHTSNDDLFSYFVVALATPVHRISKVFVANRQSFEERQFGSRIFLLSSFQERLAEDTPSSFLSKQGIEVTTIHVSTKEAGYDFVFNCKTACNQPLGINDLVVSPIDDPVPPPDEPNVGEVVPEPDETVVPEPDDQDIVEDSECLYNTTTTKCDANLKKRYYELLPFQNSSCEPRKYTTLECKGSYSVDDEVITEEPKDNTLLFVGIGATILVLILLLSAAIVFS